MPTIGNLSVSFVDRSNKSSKTELPTPVLTALNLSAQTGLNDALLTDIAALSLGVETRRDYANEVKPLSTVPPTDNHALRSAKWAVTYQDNVTGKKYVSTIPVANRAAVTFLTGTNIVNLTIAPASTFVTDFQAAVRVNGTNAVTVLKMQAVGRSE